ncbi:MAG: hypothetical protein PHE53_01820 [Thermoguttaceae bacterium]|nr:hypothetical protein [Thermoguttaceae bacterium]
MKKRNNLGHACFQSHSCFQRHTCLQWLTIVSLLLVTFLSNVGCGDSSKPKKQAAMSHFFNTPTKSEKTATPSGSAESSASSSEPLASSSEPPAAVPQPEVRRATGNVTGTGQELGNNPISLSIKTYFTGREKITFDIQIPDAMRLYKAVNEYPPRTAQEYYNQIIVANQIPLPGLPPNDRYQYDPTTGELNVVRFPQGMMPPSDPSLPPNFVP